jgi:hypothetical protein
MLPESFSFKAKRGRDVEKLFLNQTTSLQWLGQKSRSACSLLSSLCLPPSFEEYAALIEAVGGG